MGVAQSDVILQLAYRITANETVPAPTAESPHIPWWYDHGANQMRAFALAGFSAILGPPPLKTQSGDQPTGDGYGPYDDYDIGTKNQMGSIPTRFGTGEQLRRLVAIARANGLDYYVDTVPHQRMGGRDGVYQYLGADGKTKNGRFGKTPSCFMGSPPRVPRDPVAGGAGTDFAFGDELCPINATPKGYVMDGLINAGDWLFRTLGCVGARIDDCKGLAAEFVKKWTSSKAMKGGFFVGEYYDGNPATLDYYVWNDGEYGTGGAISVFDFTTHFAVEAMCNNTSRFNMEQLRYNGGYFQRSPFRSVTFVENPDTDTDGFATVIWNKVLGYAFILLSEGRPCVYYKDYSTDAGCYGLKQWIDNLMWIRQKFTYGRGTTVRYADYQTYVFERNGGLLVGLNNDQYNAYYRTVSTSFGANVRLHDYTGHAENDVWTDEHGNATIWLPPNDNGQSYTAWAPVGFDEPITVSSAETISQEFFGASDLDTPACVNGANTVGRIYCDAYSTVTLKLSTQTLGSDETISLALLDAQGKDVAALLLTPGAFLASDEGWYTIVLTGEGLPIGGVPFTVTATYRAPQELPL